MRGIRSACAGKVIERVLIKKIRSRTDCETVKGLCSVRVDRRFANQVFSVSRSGDTTVPSEEEGCVR